jgi:hypothetical protein
MEGRIPTEFTATQNMAKWTPQLNRVFSIPGASDEAVIDWNEMTADISLPEMFASHQISIELLSRVRTRFGTAAMVACLGHNGRWTYNHDGAWSPKQAEMNPHMVQPNYGYRGGYGGGDYWNARLPNEIMQQPELFRWIYQHSMAIPHGLFGLISSTGPMGGPHLTDLPILDASDPSLALLIVIVPQADDFVAYRKLLHLTESGKTQ